MTHRIFALCLLALTAGQACAATPSETCTAAINEGLSRITLRLPIAAEAASFLKEGARLLQVADRYTCASGSWQLRLTTPVYQFGP